MMGSTPMRHRLCQSGRDWWALRWLWGKEHDEHYRQLTENVMLMLLYLYLRNRCNRRCERTRVNSIEGLNRCVRALAQLPIISDSCVPHTHTHTYTIKFVCSILLTDQKKRKFWAREKYSVVSCIESIKPLAPIDGHHKRNCIELNNIIGWIKMYYEAI